MKKICLSIVIAFLMCFSLSFSQTRISISNRSSLSSPSKISFQSNEQQVEIKINISFYEKLKKYIDNKNFDLIQLRDFNGHLDVGKPDLPILGKLILLPNDYPLTIEVDAKNYIDIENINIAPNEPPSPESERNLDSWIDKKVYESSDYFPPKIAWVEPVKTMRGYKTTVLWISPIQFSPKMQKARLYYDFTVKVKFGRTEIDPIPGNIRSPQFSRLIENAVINKNLMNKINEISLQSMDESYHFFTGCDYLIVTDDKFLEAAETLAQWKKMCGLQVKIVTVEEIGNTSAEIQSYIKNAYQNWNPAPLYVLFLGDAEYVPTNYYTQHSREDNGIIGTDLYYTTVDGNDYFPDIISGRIPVDEPIEANSFVNKIVQYEQNPVSDADFYRNAAAAAYFQDDDDTDTPNYNERDGYEDRRFILTSEEIRDFLIGKGYDVQRIYYAKPAVNPQFYNNGKFADGQPIPKELLRSSGFQWDGDAEDISNAIENGIFLLLHRDHGSRRGWGDPSYVVGNVKKLSNGNKLPVVFSMNCATGWFDNETDAEITNTREANESFVEAWIRNLRGGAVGVFGSTRISYSGYNDILTKGIIDAIWQDFLQNDPTEIETFSLGEALNFGKLTMAQVYSPNNIRLTEFEEFHYFGDPAMHLWTKKPQTLTADLPDSLPINATSCTVLTEPNCIISLVQNGKLLASQHSGATGNANLSFKPISSTEAVKCIVQKLNFKPLIAEIPVSKSNAGALVISDIGIIDENNDNEINIAETIIWSIELQNQGDSPLQDVKLAIISNDEHINVLKSACSVQEISSKSSLAVDSLMFKVSNICTPEHLVEMDLLVEVLDDTIIYPLDFKVKAGIAKISVDPRMIAESVNFGDSLRLELNVQNSGYDRAVFRVSDISKKYIAMGDTSKQQWIASSTGSGNVFLAKENLNLLQFKFFMNVQTPVRACFYIYAGAELTGQFSLQFYQEVQLQQTGRQYAGIEDINFSFQKGNFYFLGVAWTDGDAKICRSDKYPPVESESISLLTGAVNLGGIPPADTVMQTFDKIFAFNQILEFGAGNWLKIPVIEKEILPKASDVFPILVTVPRQDTTLQTKLKITCESFGRDSLEVPVTISSRKSAPEIAVTVAEFKDLGNGDGIINCNESVIVPIFIKNIGGVQADSLELHLSGYDSMIFVTDSSEVISQLNSDEEMTIDAFHFSVSNLAPDGYVESLKVTVRNDSAVIKELPFDFTIHESSPVISISPDSIIAEADSFLQNLTFELLIENSGYGAFRFKIENPIQRDIVLGEMNEQTPLPLNNGCGNIYFLVEDLTLQKIKTLLEVTSAGRIYFYVFEGESFNGEYHRIYHCSADISGSGQIFAESKRINVTLNKNKFYYIGYCWNGDMKAVRLKQIAPISFSDFQAMAGTYSGPGFPPANTLDISNSSPMLFYQELTIGQGTWLSAHAEKNTIAADGSGKILVELFANESDTMLSTNLVLKSLGDNSRDFSVPVIFRVTASATSVEQADKIAVTNFSLDQNYPNPFNPNTTIAFQVPFQSKVTIKIFNTLGQEIKTLISQNLNPGNYKIQWDGADSFGIRTASGIYIVRMITDHLTLSRKIILLK